MTCSDQPSLTATIKFGSSPAPWLVVRGSAEQLRAQICGAFGLPMADYASVPIARLIAEASNTALAAERIESAFGAQLIDEAGPDPWAEVQGVTPDLSAAIAAATTREDLRKLYVDNVAAFTASPELLRTWRQKGAGLPA